MESYIDEITKLFMIKNCCYNNERKKSVIKLKKDKFEKYRGFNGLYQHSNIDNTEIKKVYDEIENNMEFKREINPKTPRRVIID
tara:strand:- start:1365 stop:1616 length:252 start_codon:yes stop_codon:yes gene_type:complete